MTATTIATAAVAGAPTEPGPVATAQRILRDWLDDTLAGAGPVVMGTPPSPPTPSAPAGTPSRLCVWPVAVLSDQGARGGHGPMPTRFRVRYALAPDGPLDEAARLLDLVLVALADQERLRLVVEPASAPARPPSRAVNLTIQLDVPVQIAAPRQEVARVRGGLRLGGSPLCEINGRLVGPDDVPLVGMTVTVPSIGTAVTTGSGGEFRLTALPGGRSTLLHISGHGLRLQVEVPPETTEPVVIHCNIEEV